MPAELPLTGHFPTHQRSFSWCHPSRRSALLLPEQARSTRDNPQAVPSSRTGYEKNMKIPQKIEILVQNGLVDEVVCQLMSGKEADVYVVRSKGEVRCAKVYKDAGHRSFSKQAQYQEGRKVRNSRQ